MRREVVRADPSVRGDTATSVTKAVTTTTGLEVFVPNFVEVGDTIRIDINARTIEAADHVYGVTMQEPGVSRRGGVRFEEHDETRLTRRPGEQSWSAAECRFSSQTLATKSFRSTRSSSGFHSRA